ncbi:MAG: PatB family C-S lyase [Bacteroidales bacterium]|nr:PatB family C-S lyase [Bacteroidales bacterium]
MTYNFDEQIDRSNTHTVKYDLRKAYFGKEDVLPMWVADMDFRTPGFVTDAVKKRAEHEIYGYTIRPDEFQKAIISWLDKRHGWQVMKNWIGYSPGAVPAVTMALLANTQPGDKVIVQPPVYFPFFGAVKDNGRQLVYNQLKNENGHYRIDFEDMKAKIDKRTRMLILCNPHNPVGRSWTKEELKQLSEICIENDLFLISDDLHNDLILPGNKYYPVVQHFPKMAERTITVMAPSKTFNLAGLTTSFVVIPDEKLKNRYDQMLENYHLYIGNLFGTEALIAAYRHGEDWLEQLLEYLQANVDYMDEFLQTYIPQIKMVKPEATYLAWLDCSGLGLNDEGLRKFMIHKAGLGFSHGSTFGPGGEQFQRVNFACPRSTVEMAMEKLRKAI